MVQGTVSGTKVTATTIRDGVMPGGMKSGTGTGAGKGAPQMPSGITGNGEPVVGGNITAINGSTLTITNKSNVTYTIDATNATIMKGNATSTLSNVAVGDSVVVQGTVNGTSVTASTVIDQGVPKTTTSGAVHNFHGSYWRILHSPLWILLKQLRDKKTKAPRNGRFCFLYLQCVQYKSQK